MEGEEFETTSLEDKEQQEKEFLNNLHNLMLQLSEPCRAEFESALQTQDMNALSEPCKAELASAAQSSEGFEGAKQQAAREAAAELMAQNMDTNTIYYVFAFVFVALVAVGGYVVWINRKLSEAGYYTPRKALSKKKLAKERSKAKGQ